MYFVQFEITPRRDREEFSDIAAAIVNCWIQTDSLPDAIDEARRHIANQGWFVDDPDEAYVISREDYDDDSPGLQYFEQALIDRAVFVFHTCPIDEVEDSADE